MTYWLIHTTTGYFQFDDEMGAPIHFLSGLLKHCDFVSMTPIEAEDPIPAPVENKPIERVDVNPHIDGRTHLLGGFNTGDGVWTCHDDCHCKTTTEEDQEEAADEHEKKVRKVREVNDGRPVGAIDHCGHCGEEGHRRSRKMKCTHPQCQGHCVYCIDGPSCHWED